MPTRKPSYPVPANVVAKLAPGPRVKPTVPAMVLPPVTRRQRIAAIIAVRAAAAAAAAPTVVDGGEQTTPAPAVEDVAGEPPK
jgi:hypothetical protein